MPPYTNLDLLSLFVSDGTVVIEKLKGNAEKRFEATNRSHVATETPLVVVINGGSASASEIVAGAIGPPIGRSREIFNRERPAAGQPGRDQR